MRARVALRAINEDVGKTCLIVFEEGSIDRFLPILQFDYDNWTFLSRIYRCACVFPFFF